MTYEVKWTALLLAFMIWVGGWGFMDALIAWSTDDVALQFCGYFLLLFTGLLGPPR